MPLPTPLPCNFRNRNFPASTWLAIRGLGAILFLLALTVPGLHAQTPSINTAPALAISNRQPALDELGYLPADGSIPRLNPPSLAWLPEKPAKTYIVQWATRSDFVNPTTVADLWLNCYTHNAPLTPSDYWWRYRFAASNGIVSTWSIPRKFTVTKEAARFPLPSIQQRRELLPKSHPRLFLRPENLSELRQMTNGALARSYRDLYEAANKLYRAEPPAEPTTRGSATDKNNLEALKNWWPNRERAVLACDQAETLAFTYLLSGEKRFGEAARKRVLALAAWDPDGPTNFRLNCEAGKPLLHRISRAYDWSYDMYSAEDRATIQKVVARRIRDAWVSGEVGSGVGHITRPFNSHGNRTWHKIGESAIVFLGEIPEAETWLDFALNKYYTCYPVWADDDGGWHEGLAYFAGYMGKVTSWFQAADSAFKIDPFMKPVLSSLSDFALYIAPPHSPNMGFGDLSYRAGISSGWGVFMDYFVRAGAAHGAKNAPYWQWWNEQWKLKPAGGVLEFVSANNLPPAPKAKPPVDLPQSKVFHGTGIASLHTTLLDSRDDVHFLFKSSPRGSMSHGHNPQNTFQLNGYGEALITSCGYRDYHGSQFHYKWVHETIAQNGVLVDGKGQLPHSAKSRGRITASAFTNGYDYVCGDAVEAYEGRLERALRHVLFIKPGVIVMYDDLAAKAPSEFQFMLHALSPFKLNESDFHAEVRRPEAGVLVAYLPAGDLKFRQWDGFEPKSIRGEFPNQWHFQASTVGKKPETEMLTVLAPFKGTKAPTLTCTRFDSPTAVGARIELDGETWLAAFKKYNADDSAEVAGIRFSEAFLVRKISQSNKPL